jgi:dipeptidase E
MKLYLSSYKFGDKPEKLTQLAPSNKRIALIANALDFSADLDRRAASEQKQIDGLKELGFDPEVLDLREYFGKKDALKTKMDEYGSIWAIGGNAFLLRSAMEQSGLAEILREYKTREDKSEFLYAGFSAGACVLAPSLKGIELADEPNKVTEIYGTPVIWEGIGIIDYSIAPHYRSDHPESAMIEETVKYFEREGVKYKALRDGEVIISEI